MPLRSKFCWKIASPNGKHKAKFKRHEPCQIHFNISKMRGINYKVLKYSYKKKTSLPPTHACLLDKQVGTVSKIISPAGWNIHEGVKKYFRRSRISLSTLMFWTCAINVKYRHHVMSCWWMGFLGLYVLVSASTPPFPFMATGPQAPKPEA